MIKIRVIADLHIHSRFSRATSQKLCIKEIDRFAGIKGLNIIGTGDFTHPKWLKELQATLTLDSETGLYKFSKNFQSPVHFMATTEVNTEFLFEDTAKRVHHVILTPNIDTALQINDRLWKYGDLELDGRPKLAMTPPHLVEEVMEVSRDNMVFPAHAWTPWFSVLGAFNDFDSIEACYQDMIQHIHAIETGLSSDPPMNWRLSGLDKFTLLSNSDSHSFWPWRIGREANAFDLEKITYKGILDAIRLKDTSRLKYTIETYPTYGKYHWTGHRNCQVALSPKDAMKFRNFCPVCHKKLTKGVDQRVNELADRPQNYKPQDIVDFVRLLPLSEIIATVLDAGSPSTKRVWIIYNSLIKKFGDEYTVLLSASSKELQSVVTKKISEAIIRVREGRIRIVPGYDGVYGQVAIFDDGSKPRLSKQKVNQLNLEDFI